jgi:hypothetical protein
MIALFRDPLTGNPTGIHRTRLPATWQQGMDVERMELGGKGAIQLWPLDGSTRLVAGEGIETVLSAAQAFTLPNGSPLKPAWALGSADNLGKLPILTMIQNLILLVDNDENGRGQRAAMDCEARWENFGTRVNRLTPDKPGTDFNDLLLEQLRGAQT